MKICENWRNCTFLASCALAPFSMLQPLGFQHTRMQISSNLSLKASFHCFQSLGAYMRLCQGPFRCFPRLWMQIETDALRRSALCHLIPDPRLTKEPKRMITFHRRDRSWIKIELQPGRRRPHRVPLEVLQREWEASWEGLKGLFIWGGKHYYYYYYYLWLSHLTVLPVSHRIGTMTMTDYGFPLVTSQQEHHCVEFLCQTVQVGWKEALAEPCFQMGFPLIISNVL